MRTILIDGNSLTIKQVMEVSRLGFEVQISPDALEKVNKARIKVESILKDKEIAYGINTGFGKFSDVRIAPDEADNLQKNLIRSYGCGVGEPFSKEVVRAAMLLKANTLVKGYSGVRPVIIETLVKNLNLGIHPVMPRDGSGVSGDIIPLSHMVLAMMGEGFVLGENGPVESSLALKEAGIEPIELKAKEGLSLINGTQVMSAIGALGVYDGEILIKNADIAASLTLEALRAVKNAFFMDIHELRPHNGQLSTARNLTMMTRNSELLQNQGDMKLQDAYSIRCIPQVHGVSKDTLGFVRGIIATEINSMTDNPVVFTDELGVVSGGNFHGEYISVALDFLSIAMAELGSISERRIERLVNPALSGLPAFLTYKGGLNNGYMATQYTAASLVAENRLMANPASTDTIPSSANQEDFVSMGTVSAKKCGKIIKNVENIIAIEMMAACQGIEFREKTRLGDGTKIAYSAVRSEVSEMDDDRPLYLDINKLAEIIKNGYLISTIESEMATFDL